jgi:hypothetical protein
VMNVSLNQQPTQVVLPFVNIVVEKNSYIKTKWKRIIALHIT